MRKKCLICGRTLHGRIDKKFCSDHCRNKYHNSLDPNEARYIRHVNYILRKNRRILMEFNRKGIVDIPALTLMHAGFDFKFITNISTKQGEIFYYCYEHGYKERCDGIFSLVEDRNVKDSILFY